VILGIGKTLLGFSSTAIQSEIRLLLYLHHRLLAKWSRGSSYGGKIHSTNCYLGFILNTEASYWRVSERGAIAGLAFVRDVALTGRSDEPRFSPVINTANEENENFDLVQILEREMRLLLNDKFAVMLDANFGLIHIISFV
jgi:hypothetical protein